MRFCWVQAQPGVEGKEIVDQLAKIFLKLDIIDINVPLGGGEAKCKIRDILIDVWQKRWDSEPKCRHLYALQRKVGGPIFNGQIRKEEVVIA